MNLKTECESLDLIQRLWKRQEIDVVQPLKVSSRYKMLDAEVKIKYFYSVLFWDRKNTFILSSSFYLYLYPTIVSN
jgi:hypothetical protein